MLAQEVAGVLVHYLEGGGAIIHLPVGMDSVLGPQLVAVTLA